MGMIKVKEYHERLVQGVKKVLDSKEFKEFLSFSARFHRYSFNNTLLIWCQRPRATRVAGMKAWNFMGRYVKKGEKGIAIFAPLIKKSKESQTESTEDAKMDPENEAERLIGFSAVYVWDIEQTDGKPVPELETEAPVMDGNPEVLFARILQASPIPVEYEDIKGKARGYYMPKEKKIVLSSRLRPEEKAKTILHELAHHLSHSEVSEGLSSGLDRPSEEVISEGAAFMSSAHFGLDSSGYSFPYVASWSQDAEKVLKAGNAMRKVAVQLIEMVEEEKEVMQMVAVAEWPL